MVRIEMDIITSSFCNENRVIIPSIVIDAMLVFINSAFFMNPFTRFGIVEFAPHFIFPLNIIVFILSNHLFLGHFKFKEGFKPRIIMFLRR